MNNNTNKNETETPEDEIIYSGNNVPVFLRIIYIAFILFAVTYFTKYLYTDLLTWLK